MKPNEKYSLVPFVLLLSVASISWMLVFGKLGGAWDGEEHIKNAQYLFNRELAFEDLTAPPALAYPLFHVVLKIVKLITNFDYVSCLAAVLTFSNVASVLIYRKLMLEYLHKDNSYYIDIVSVALEIFMCARCSLINDGRIYFLQGGANPVHNPTQLFVRPFGLLCFYYFVKFLKYDRNEKKYDNLICFAVTLFVSVFAKPSFAVVLLPAMAIYTLIYMIKEKRIFIGIKTFAAVLPSVIALFWQLSFVGDYVKSYIHFGTYYSYSVSTVVGITIIMTPIVFLVFDCRKIKENMALGLALLVYIVSWCTFFLITQGGTNDYIWGYNLAIGLVTAFFMAEAYISKEDTLAWKIRKILAYIIFAYQVYVGFLYINTAYIAMDYRL